MKQAKSSDVKSANAKPIGQPSLSRPDMSEQVRLLHRPKRCELDECSKNAVEDGYCSSAHFEKDVYRLEREIQTICRKEGKEWLVRNPKLDNREPPLRSRQSLDNQKPCSKRKSARI